MKVLVATDGSKYGRWAIGWLEALPLAQKPQVTVLHVIDLAALRAPFMVQPVIVGTERYLRAEINRLEAQAKKTKQEAASLLASLGLKGRALVERGAVAATIVKRAGRGTKLLAIGSRGLDALDRFMLGSVSTQVVHHAPSSVLVVKEEPRPLARLVLAVDGSKASDKAMRFLLRSMAPADPQRVTVTVVHAMPYLKYPEVREGGKRIVQRTADKFVRAGYSVEEAPRLGKPADEILAVAKQHKADLIVTGAKGLGAVSRFLLGSVSTKVLQESPCSVLIVH